MSNFKLMLGKGPKIVFYFCMNQTNYFWLDNKSILYSHILTFSSAVVIVIVW